MPALIDCDVLTGFLGSGKTTLLKAWLQSPQSAGTAVVVNEIGEIGLDNLVLAQVAENITLLESGCLCCTLSGSLRETILDLRARTLAGGLPLTRIVVETTGLADPLPILHSLLGDKALGETVRLNQVIVTMDGQQGARQLARQPESLRQLAVAESAVITKTDLADPERIQALAARVAQVSPAARIWMSRAGDPAIGVFDETAGSAQRRVVEAAVHSRSDTGGAHPPAGHAHDEWPDACHAGHAHAPRTDASHSPAGATAGELFHQRVSTLAFHVDAPVSWAGIAAWWHLVSRRFGEDLLRCKGLLRVRVPGAADSFVFVQTVGRVFHSPETLDAWPDADERSRLVCIGAGLDRQWLGRSLAALRIDEPGLLPETLEQLHALMPNTTEKP